MFDYVWVVHALLTGVDGWCQAPEYLENNASDTSDFICIYATVAKLLWTEVLDESSNNSGRQSMYFLSSKKRIYYI